MTLKAKLASSTPSFAHLVGRTPAAAAAAEDDRKEGETDEEYEKRKKEEEEKGAKAKAAEDEDEKRDDESDEDHKARVASNRARRATAEEDDKKKPDAAGKDDDKGDDDSDSGDMRSQGIGQARMRERARCAAIFGEPAAAINPRLAAELAFTTDLPRSQAVRLLRAGGIAPAVIAPPRRTLDERMAAMPTLKPVGGSDARPAGTNADKGNAYNEATKILAAGMRRRGEPQAAINAFLAERAA